MEQSKGEVRHPTPPKVVKVGDIVLAKLGALDPPSQCKVEKLVIVSTGRPRDEAELFLVQRLYKVVLKTSGRKLTGPDDFSDGPWEEGGRVVELPGEVVQDVL